MAKRKLAATSVEDSPFDEFPAGSDFDALTTSTLLGPVDPVLCARSINFTIPGAPGVNIKVVEDAGSLDFTTSVNNTAQLIGDLGGIFFQFNDAKLSTLQVSGSLITVSQISNDNVINLGNGTNMVGAVTTPFDVGVEFGIGGIGANHEDITSATFVLSDTAHDLSLDDLGNDLFGARVTSVGAPGTRRTGGEKITGLAPYAPTATPDTVTTLEDISITVPASALATDKNSGAILTISEVGSGADGPQYGTVKVAPDGKSLIYTPTTLDYEVNGILTGNQDAFLVCVHDNFGGQVTSSVTVHATPVADTPTVNVQLLARHDDDPINEVRLLVTCQSGDFGTVNQGSDYIQSIQLGLSGNVTAGTTISDTGGLLVGNTITLDPSNSGYFQDEIDLLMPTDVSLNDTLAVTATAAETEGTGSLATAPATKNQSIVLNNAQLQQDLTFLTSGQSIWQEGAAFSKEYGTGFLGVDKSASTSQSVLVASASASAHVRAGFQADLKISAGDIGATLPFHIGLDSTYNVSTDTLQTVWTDAQLGGGHFTAHGPGGSFSFGLDFGLTAKAKATIFGTTVFNLKTTLGPVTKPVFGLSLNSTQLRTTIPLPGGLSLTLAFPNVGTVNGSNPNPGTISQTGISNDFVNLSGDLIAMASNLIFGTDVTDIDFGVGSIDILDLILGVGLNVVQKFDLSSSGLMPTLFLEDGTFEPLMPGLPLTVPNASIHDTNQDGHIDLSLGLVPQATLTNNSSIGADLNASITALAISVSHLGSFTAFKHGTNIQLGTFPAIYSKSFDLKGFNTQTVTQTV